MKATSKKEFEEVMEGDDKKGKPAPGVPGVPPAAVEIARAEPPPQPDKPKINYGRPKNVGG